MTAQTLYLLLGRHGDVMAGLPIVQHEVAQGRPACVMVSREYSGVLDGTSLNRIVWEHGWTQVRAAYTSVHADWPKTVVLQQYSTDGWPVHHATDSFVKEMYRIAGKLPLFGKCPLTFDRRSAEREALLLTDWPDYPVILLATDGQSSPFRHRDALRGLLEAEFGARTVLCLDDVRAERIYDLLAFFGRAACLVTIDSALLHLAQAAPRLPVIALVASTPSLWHGSPAYAGQRLRIRYGDYAKRVPDIVAAVGACLVGSSALGERPAPPLAGPEKLAPRV